MSRRRAPLVRNHPWVNAPMGPAQHKDFRKPPLLRDEPWFDASLHVADTLTHEQWMETKRRIYDANNPPMGMLYTPSIEVQSLTNAEKLSLPANTPVGTQVQVTDGFVVSGVGAANGFYRANGQSNGKDFYQRVPITRQDGQTYTFEWDGDTTWYFNDPDGGSVDTSTDDVAQPWQATFSTASTQHPGHQQLLTPSTAQGGVFLPVATELPNAVGIYPAQGIRNGKEFYTLVGTQPFQDNDVRWESDVALTITRPGDFTSAGWVWEEIDGYYYSLSDVATPDLATDWKNASDDSPASITVTSVTQGELVAGLTVAGAGQTNDTNATFAATGDQLGRKFYTPVDHPGYDPVGWNGVWYLGDGAYTGGAAKAFPWEPTDYSGSPPPTPTATRNDVASEANWTNL